MKRARVCGFDLYVPDNVAAWDAVAEDSPWEYERIHSILNTLAHGDVLYDVGAEAGWMSAIYGQHVGGENMVLIEPSPEFWPNIKGCWDWNHLGTPIATVEGFAAAREVDAHVHVRSWPKSATGPECGAMAYRHLRHHADIPTVTIDHIGRATNLPAKGITIDVEGAELAVLRGAETTLAVHRPYVWCSIHADLMVKDFGTHPDLLQGYMLGHGYRAKWLRTDHEEHWLFTPEEIPVNEEVMPA